MSMIVDDKIFGLCNGERLMIPSKPFFFTNKINISKMHDTKKKYVVKINI